jgi:hypothetical protein
LGLRPPPDQGIERILMRQPRGEIDEPGILRPLGVSRHCGQGAPFVLREAGDGQPPIFPSTGIDAVRRRRFVRGAVAVQAGRVGLESVQAIRSLKPRLARDKGVQVAIRIGIPTELVSQGVAIE